MKVRKSKSLSERLDCFLKDVPQDKKWSYAVYFLGEEIKKEKYS